MGDAARARRAEGGKQAVGRDSLPTIEYRQECRHVAGRNGGRCECCRLALAVDPEHAYSRSARSWRPGGDDTRNNLWAACRRCHDWKAEPYDGPHGRLTVTPLGQERFRFRVDMGTKWNPTTVAEWEVGPAGLEAWTVLPGFHVKHRLRGRLPAC